MKKKNNKKGFTLVECIVAISIIAMFSTLAITIFQTTLKTTNDQWDKFQVLQMADNVLACFVSADDIEDFERHLDSINDVGDEEASQVVLIPDTHDEFDPSNTPVTVPYTKIRAHEADKKVDFLNGDETVVSFEYSDSSIYEKDVHGAKTVNNNALDKLGLYEYEAVELPGATEGTTNYVAYSSATTGNNSKKKITVISNGETATYTNTDNSIKKTVSLNAFEKYLYSKHWYLKPVSKTDSTGGMTGTIPGSLTCDVYNFDGTPVKSDGHQMRIKLSLYFDSGKIFSTGDSYDRWSKDPSVVNLITYRYEGSGDTTWRTLKNDEGKSFVGEGGSILSYRFTWECYPYILFGNVGNSDTKGKDGCFTFSYTPAQQGGLNYTDYILKPEYTSEIHHALVGDGAVQLFNADGEGANMLFKYTGNDTDTPLKKLDFVNKGKYAGTELDIWFKTLGAIDVNKVTFYDSEKTIRFLDKSNNVSVFFTYNDIAVYNQDKADICESNGAFYKYYSADYSLKTPGKVSIRKGQDSTGKVFYQLVLGNDSIFVSYADSIGIKDSANMNDSFTKIRNNDKQVEQTVSAITKYYSYSTGRHVMVAKATFSKYVGSLETEPVLKVWIMTYNDYDSWKQLAGDTPQEPTAGELIISYRKG